MSSNNKNSIIETIAASNQEFKAQIQLRQYQEGLTLLKEDIQTKSYKLSNEIIHHTENLLDVASDSKTPAQKIPCMSYPLCCFKIDQKRG